MEMISAAAKRGGIGIVGRQHGHGIGADAEEGGGGQRNIARGATEEGPAGRQRHVDQDVDQQGEPVGIGKARRDQQRQQGGDADGVLGET